VKLILKIVIYSVVLTTAAECFAQTGTITKVPTGSRNGNPHGYVEYLPANFDSSLDWPVIIWYHGVGPVGSGSSSDLEKILNNAIMKWLDNGNDVPFIVLAPQDAGGFWGGRKTIEEPTISSKVEQFYEWARTEYETPTNEYGWHLAYASGAGKGFRDFCHNNPPSLFTVASHTLGAALTGAGTEAEEANLASSGAAFWFHHDKNDGKVGAGQTENFYLATVYRITGANYPPDYLKYRYTQYDLSAHGAMNRIYDGSGRNDPQVTGDMGNGDVGETLGADFYEWTQDETWYDWLLSNPKIPFPPYNLFLSKKTIPDGTSSGEVVAELTAEGTPGFEYGLASGDGDDDNHLFSVEGNLLIINETVDIDVKDSYSIRLMVESTQGLGTLSTSFSLSVTPLIPLTVSVKDEVITYGNDLPNWELSYDGFVNGDSPEDLDSQPVVNTTASNQSSVGTYDVVLSGGDSDTYEFVFQNGELSITPAPLTISAQNQSMIYGNEIPELKYTYSGFLNDDSESSLSVKPVITTTATPGSSVGTYPIEISDAEAMNYTIAYNNATLTIEPATLTVKVQDESIHSGSEIPDFELSYQGFVNGDDEESLAQKPVATTDATSDSAPGTYTIEVSGGESTQYTFAYLNGTLTITKADPDVVTKVSGNSNNQWMLGPNPATRKIAFDGKPEYPKSCEVFTLTGNKILSSQSTTGISNLDISALPEGIYMVLLDHKNAFKLRVIR